MRAIYDRKALRTGRAGVVGGVVALHHRADLLHGLVHRPALADKDASDKIGTEICAALKNIIALCAGCCDGMGYGDNTKALLMTRGLAEMARLGVALGGR